MLGKNILGSGFDLDIDRAPAARAPTSAARRPACFQLARGQTGYPKLKPPFPAVSGLFGCPTIVNNVETLAVRAAHRQPGRRVVEAVRHAKKNGGIKLVLRLAATCRSRAIYEMPLGITLRELIYDHCGGMHAGPHAQGRDPGRLVGASCACRRTRRAHGLRQPGRSGTMLGSGGVIVMDDDAPASSARLDNLLRFYHHETCGQCTPCREGSGWAEKSRTAS